MLPHNGVQLAFVPPNPNDRLAPCEAGVRRFGMTALLSCLVSFALVLGFHHVTSAVLPSTIYLALGQQTQTRNVLSPHTAQPMMRHNYVGHAPGAIHLPMRKPFQTKSSQLRLSATSKDTGSDITKQDAANARFQTWAEAEAGLSISKVVLANFGGLRGVMATEDIYKGNVLIGIPKSSLITTSAEVESNPIPTIDDAYWKRARFTVRLALKLLNEKDKGSASFFAPYIAILPKSQITPINWDKKLLEELQYPLMVDLVAKQQKEWRGAFDELRSSSPDFEVTWEDFLWAMGVVVSRSDRGELPRIWGDKAIEHCLLPWIDMINSRSKSPTVISFNSVSQKLELRAGESFQKGEQVWISYDKSNDDLLQYYGFVERDNPKDSFCMSGLVDVILKDAPQAFKNLAEQRLQEIKDAGLSPALEFTCLTRNAPDPKATQALRMLFTPDGEDPLLNKDRVNPAIEKLVYQTLYVLGAQTIAAWPTTLAQDVDALKTLAAGPQRLAIEYRIEKKRVLAQFLAAIEPRL